MKLKLLYGDCIEKMKSIEDNSIDLCLTDPPYGTTACKWDNVIPFEPMWKELKRIVKDNGAICLFGSEPFSSHLRMSNIKMFKYDWIWQKNRPANINQSNTQPMKYHENISVFSISNTTYFKQMINRSPGGKKTYHSGQRNNTVIRSTFKDLNRIPNKKDYSFNKYDKNMKNPSDCLNYNKVKNTIHPTQKPVPLLEYLIKTYTLEKETVLDFTMGSGSTGIACKNLNRDFIGIENNREYFIIAKRRIKQK